MASYTTLDTDGLLPGEPVTSSKMLALNENPTAIAEGVADAPKIQSEALEPLIVGWNTDVTSTNTIRGMVYWFGMFGTAVDAGSPDVRYRTSTNGGTTKTDWTVVYTDTILSEAVVMVFRNAAVGLPVGTNYIEFDLNDPIAGLDFNGSALLLGGLA